MKRHEVQDFLNQGRFVDIEIQSKLEQLHNLRHTLVRTAELKEINVQESKKNGVEESLVKISQKSVDIDNRIQELTDIKLEISKMIDNVPDMVQRVVLTERYVNNKSWESIGNKIGYGTQNVFRIHRKALESIEKLCSKMN